jgi:anti-sigma28 factor (negative regulator of flagellin synthesis)
MRTPRSDSSAARCGAVAAPVPHRVVMDPRVARVRTAIAAGRFRVDAEAVADKLLADLYVSLARKPGHH